MPRLMRVAFLFVPLPPLSPETSRHNTATADSIRGEETEMNRMMREKEVRNVTGLSRVTRWRMERRGEFPRKVRLTKRCVGWWEHEVFEFLQQKAWVRG